MIGDKVVFWNVIKGGDHLFKTGTYAFANTAAWKEIEAELCAKFTAKHGYEVQRCTSCDSWKSVNVNK